MSDFLSVWFGEKRNFGVSLCGLDLVDIWAFLLVDPVSALASAPVYSDGGSSQFRVFPGDIVSILGNLSF